MRMFITTTILCLLAVTASAQEMVRLSWKLAPNESLRYQTIMNQIDEAQFSFDFPMLDTANDPEAHDELESLLQEMNKAFDNVDFESVLTSENEGIVDIVVKGIPKADDGAEPDPLQQMLSGVQLRGAVYTDGGLHSFWVKSSQKNLIALLFELPKEPVSIGDSWPLEVNFISNDQNFQCAASEKWGQATLVDLEKVEGETVAVIHYNFGESVEGSFGLPGVTGETGEKPLSMMFTHQAVGRFSIDKGRWLVYDGLLRLKADGFMNSNQKTKLTLKPHRAEG